MKSAYNETRVLTNEKISDNVYKMTVLCNDVTRPGQFFMLRNWGTSSPYLSRPISICDDEYGKLTFLYLATGKGTKLFAELKTGDKINLLGPQGNGFDIEKLTKDTVKKIAVVAGGIGIAPFLYLAKELKKKDIELDFFAGYTNQPYFVYEMEPYFDKINIFTLDNTVLQENPFSDNEKIKLQPGYPTDTFNEDDYDYVLSCGPTPMMNALKNKMKNKEKLYISLENHMGCGIGVCLSCSCKTKNAMKKVCTGGPIFNAAELE